MSDWKSVGRVDFGSSVRVRELSLAGVKCQVYAEARDIEFVGAALDCIESDANEHSILRVLADVLREVYAHLDMEIPDEFYPVEQAAALKARIDLRQTPVVAIGGVVDANDLRDDDSGIQPEPIPTAYYGPEVLQQIIDEAKKNHDDQLLPTEKYGKKGK